MLCSRQMRSRSLAGLLRRLLLVLALVRVPALQRQRVVLSERFGVARLEARLLHLGQDARERLELAVGEDEPPGEGLGVSLLLARADDAVVQQDAAGLQQLAQVGEVGRQLRRADVLDHPDARDLVVGAVVGVPVVGEPDLDVVLEPRLAHARAREFGLRRRDRHADGADAVVGGGVDDERAPAAADVEQALAGLQVQLAADDVELAGLRGVERLVLGRRSTRTSRPSSGRARAR